MWTISDVAGLRHRNLELTHMSLSTPSSSSLVSLSARPASNSSPSCCMRARLTGHEGKSRRSWPRTGSELRKVLATYISLSSSVHPHILMLFALSVLLELTVKITSLHLVAWAAYYSSREYTKALLEVANDCVNIAESAYANRRLVPIRV